MNIDKLHLVKIENNELLGDQNRLKATPTAQQIHTLKLKLQSSCQLDNLMLCTT